MSWKTSNLIHSICPLNYVKFSTNPWSSATDKNVVPNAIVRVSLLVCVCVLKCIRQADKSKFMKKTTCVCVSVWEASIGNVWTHKLHLNKLSITFISKERRGREREGRRKIMTFRGFKDNYLYDEKNTSTTTQASHHKNLYFFSFIKFVVALSGQGEPSSFKHITPHVSHISVKFHYWLHH